MVDLAALMIFELTLGSFHPFPGERGMFTVDWADDWVLYNPRNLAAFFHSVPLSLSPVVHTGSFSDDIIPSLSLASAEKADEHHG